MKHIKHEQEQTDRMRGRANEDDWWDGGGGYFSSPKNFELIRTHSTHNQPLQAHLNPSKFELTLAGQQGPGPTWADGADRGRGWPFQV